MLPAIQGMRRPLRSMIQPQAIGAATRTRPVVARAMPICAGV